MNKMIGFKIIVILIALSTCSFSADWNQSALERRIKIKVVLGNDKQTVMQEFQKLGVKKQSYDSLQFELENGEIRASLRQYLGKEIQLAGNYEPAAKPWENTRYGIIAVFKGRHSELHVRCSFDKNEKIIACYIRKHVDAM